MRRDVATIVAAHKMDRGRRDLYVEGTRDKSFIEWVFQSTVTPKAQVITADFLDVEIEEGGNRERLLSFLREVVEAEYKIRGFIDSDHHRLSTRVEVIPDNCWITDHRDLEGYVLEEVRVDRMLRAGCGISSPTAAEVLQQAVEVARFMAAVRVHSFDENLRLPVSKHGWMKHVKCGADGSVTIDRAKAIGGLLQAADVKLSELETVRNAVELREREMRAADPRDVVQGKDFLAVVTKQLAAIGVKVDSAGYLLFATFHPEDAANYQALTSVGEFLQAAS